MSTDPLYLNKTTWNAEEVQGNAIDLTGDAATFDIMTGAGNGDIPVKIMVLTIANLKAATLTFYLMKNGIKFPVVTLTVVADTNLLNNSYRNYCNADGVGNYYLPITDKDVIKIVTTTNSNEATIHWAAITKEA